MTLYYKKPFGEVTQECDLFKKRKWTKHRLSNVITLPVESKISMVVIQIFQYIA